MAGDGDRERFSRDSEMRIGLLGGDGSALRMGGRPVKGDLRDAFAGDGTMDQRPRGGRMIMRHHLLGDLGQRTHRLVGDEPGRTTTQDNGGDDTEARSQLQDFDAGRQVGLDVPGLLGFVGKRIQLAEHITGRHQREWHFDPEKAGVATVATGASQSQGAPADGRPDTHWG